jgi:hypothetical protein
MAANDIKALKELASGGFREITLTAADIGAATTESTVAKAKALVDEFTGDPALIYTSEGSNGWTTLTDPASFRSALELSTNGNAAGLYDNIAGQVGAVVNDYTFRINGDGVSADFDTANLTASRAYGLPDANGTIALTSDIPAAFNPAAPGAIGGTTPSTGAFTTLSASNSLTLGTSGILSGGTNTIEQRNTTSGQTFRVYNTVSGTADANFERLRIAWASNVAIIGTEKAGTGSARALEFQTDGTTRGGFTDSGAFYIGTSASFTSTGLQIQPTSNRGGLFFSNCSVDVSSSTVTIRGGSNSTDWIRVSSGLLLFQGTTTSFPALKRSSTTLQVRLADDTAFAPLEAASFSNYNVFTDASNFERGYRRWESNVLRIGTEKAGSGTARALEFQTDGTTRMVISATGDVGIASTSAPTGGFGSAVIGQLNTASGNASYVLGRDSTASSTWAVALAYRSLADRNAMLAFAGGRFAARGDAQNARFVLRCTTTTNAAVEMFLGDTTTTYLTIPSGKVIFCNIKVVGVKSDGSVVATFERQYAAKNVAGTSSEVYAAVTIGTDNAASTSLEIATVDAGDYIRIRPTGIASEVWRWVATVDAVEVAYGT